MGFFTAKALSSPATATDADCFPPFLLQSWTQSFPWSHLARCVLLATPLPDHSEHSAYPSPETPLSFDKRAFFFFSFHPQPLIPLSSSFLIPMCTLFSSAIDLGRLPISFWNWDFFTLRFNPKWQCLLILFHCFWMISKKVRERYWLYATLIEYTFQMEGSDL